jgi:hypothetical protein
VLLLLVLPTRGTKRSPRRKRVASHRVRATL